MGYHDRIAQPGPKKMLALDGGGIRGMLSLEILAGIERLIQQQTGNDLRLGDYFDYIGGTSTGAIIAAGLARGMRVDEIRRIYEDHGKEMFQPAPLYRRFRFKYRDTRLRELMQRIFGPETTFGDPDMRCLLMVMMRNATTDSPWPISNNPDAKYNDRGRSDCNLDIPLWQLVRASTAAPVYFRPKKSSWEPAALNSSGRTYSSTAESRCTTIRRSRCFSWPPSARIGSAGPSVNRTCCWYPSARALRLPSTKVCAAVE